MIKELLQRLVRDSSSIAQRLEHSHLFKRWFRDAQKKFKAGSVVDAEVANLHAAKHRFESYFRPLARFVLHVRSVLDVSLRIVAERQSDAAAVDVKSFLAWFDSEKYLQAAMCADAADETMRIIRTCDEEQWDTSTLTDMISAYKARIGFLFLDGGVLTTEGFTKYALTMLHQAQKQPVSCFFPK